MATFGFQMTPTQGQTFRFLDLDPQIKLMVYDELWRRSSPMVFRLRNFRNYRLDAVVFQIKDESDPVTGLPLWLLANREILHFGLSQLWLHSTVSWFDSRTDYSHVSRKDCSLIKPFQPTRTQFDFQIRGRSTRFDLAPPVATQTQLLLLLPRLNSNLRVLNFSMTYWFVDIEGSADPRNWSFTFPQFLNSITTFALDEINVRLEVIGDDVGDEGDFPEDAEDIRTAIEAKVALLGARFLHAGGNIQPISEIQEVDSEMPTTAIVFQARRAVLGNNWSESGGLRDQEWRWSVISD